MACQYFGTLRTRREHVHGGDAEAHLRSRLLPPRWGRVAKARGFSSRGALYRPVPRERPYVDTVRRSLADAGIDVAVYSDIRIEPDDATVERAAASFAAVVSDGMASAGGGSSMDTAKAAMAWALHPAAITEYFPPPVGAGKFDTGSASAAHRSRPTTPGTGSSAHPSR
ncbi:MAG: iron-containing alcohol dehydrogenase [Gammaproteobacteria bacterium]|nr:iron-containing alcohol dehydrogenase [Gammaproteobacteria bacterium]